MYAPLFPFVFFAMCAEVCLAQVIPSWLALLARAPLGRRSLPLRPGAARALSLTFEPAGYREAAPRTIDLERLGEPRVVRRGRLDVFFFLERGLLLAREGFSLVNRARPVVRVQVRAERDRLVLTSGFYPTSLLTLLTFLGAMAQASPRGTSGGLLFFGAVLFSLGTWAVSLQAAKRARDAAIAELEARLGALERVRVEATRLDQGVEKGDRSLEDTLGARSSRIPRT